jgi:hypothetical protein
MSNCNGYNFLFSFFESYVNCWYTNLWHHISKTGVWMEIFYCVFILFIVCFLLKELYIPWAEWVIWWLSAEVMHSGLEMNFVTFWYEDCHCLPWECVLPNDQLSLNWQFNLCVIVRQIRVWWHIFHNVKMAQTAVQSSALSTLKWHFVIFMT